MIFFTLPTGPNEPNERTEIMPKIDVAAEIDAAEARIKTLGRDTKSLAGAQKKKFAEFETLNGALFEGVEVIADSKKALKKAKDARKQKALEEEIDAQEKTFKKISAKLGPIVRDLERSGAEGDALNEQLKAEKATLVALGNSLKRTGGELDQLRTWAGEIKALIKKVGAIAETAGQVAELPSTLPRTPTL